MKETKEALIGLVVLGKLVSDRLKDGVQLDDAMAIGQALLVDGSLKEKVMAGIKDAEKIKDEVKDMDLAKILELAKVIPDLIKEIQA